jgi:hypothetical protein
MSKFHEAANLYIALGWKVFPLAAATKVPAISKREGGQGFKDATDDPAIIADWAQRFPDANIAVATGKMSGITVIDVDKRNDGFATLSKLARERLMFPACPEEETGNGGRHLIYAHHPAIGSSKDRLGRGIDVKADGGYIVVAPSWIAKSDRGPGGPYKWLQKPTGQLPPLPHWFIERMRPKPRPVYRPRMTLEVADRALEGMCAKLANEHQGNRNHLLNWAAYHAADLVQQGKLGHDTVVDRLRAAALHAGLNPKEIEATIKSALDGAFKR